MRTKINRFVLLVLILFNFSCNSNDNTTQSLEARIDSLEKQVNNSYKPGFGEFMSGIQVHHAKLWFAGINNNWDLADFEIHEIQESLDDIQNYCQNREETKSIQMINGPMDSVIHAIEQKDINSFKNNYVLLTNTCNNCHLATKHGFNIVTIPTALPVVNQDFKQKH